jgi:cobalt-zinc-cadmium efflux system outer membrane protein
LRRNPEISLEIEDVRWGTGPSAWTESTTPRAGGSGPGVATDRTVEEGTRAGLAESQMTLRLAQAVELGGKRVKRMRLAERQKDLARWDYETVRLDVLAQVAKSFVEALSAQERLALARSNVAVAEEIVSTVSARVDAGKVSPLETTKAETQLASARIAQDKAVGDLETARAELAATWGAKTPDFDRVVGDFETVVPVAPYEELARLIAKNPDVARWVDEMETRQAALQVERSRRVPDVTLTLGLRTKGLASHAQRGWSTDSDGSLAWSAGQTGFREDHEDSLIFEVLLPLPLFDRNQGGIQEAEREAARAHEEQRRAEVRAHATLYAAHEALLHSHNAAVALRDDVLPRALDTFERMQEGYRQGKFGYLDVLDAQRTLFDIRVQYVEALTAYHRVMTDVDRLIGDSLAGNDEGSQRAAPTPEETKHDQP